MSRRFVDTAKREPTKFTQAWLNFSVQTLNIGHADIILDLGFITDAKAEKPISDKYLTDVDRFTSESIFTSIIDNFQCYLGDILLLIFQTKPEILSGGSTKNSIVFDHVDINALKREIIDYHILSLGYKSIDDLNEYFKNTLKFSLTVNRLQTLRLNRLIQIRNVIAHNRGLVSKQFASKVGCKIDKIGQKVRLPNSFTTINYLRNLAVDIEEKVIEKFGVPHVIAPL